MPMPALLTTSCASCRQPGEVLCRQCRFALATSPAAIVPGGITAALSFDGAVRSAVLALKFRNRRAVAQVLAETLVRRLGLARPGGAHVDLVTWAPTSRRRSVDRGYDQAELLARAVARQLGVPCRRLLYRVHGAPQVGRSRAERLQGPSFRARPGVRLRVLVVDDVVTTGATLVAAGEALRAAGIADVRLVAVAATPARGDVRVDGRGHAKDRAQPPGRLETA
jgi:ComF family protein